MSESNKETFIKHTVSKCNECQDYILTFIGSLPTGYVINHNFFGNEIHGFIPPEATVGYYPQKQGVYSIKYKNKVCIECDIK